MSIVDFLKVMKYKRKEFGFPYRKYLDRNECVFIHIPKSAGTSILYALGINDGMGRDHLPWYVYQKANPYKYKKYFKFSFVRNPWDRVYSAYSYLSKGGNLKGDVVAQELINEFNDFDDFVVNGLGYGLFRNHPLFIPQSEYIIGVNQRVEVDFLGRFERLDEDFSIVADKLGIDSVLKKLNVKSVSGSDCDKYKRSESVDIVESIYIQDVRFFDYKYE